ncbi:hypothetical protein L218DRAFT_954992 [Marasmius fiardii PR-910]|nr:hypothetical protein L218DRAFT_954992 [Marasmius fiardii PR-910]
MLAFIHRGCIFRRTGKWYNGVLVPVGIYVYITFHIGLSRGAKIPSKCDVIR